MRVYSFEDERGFEKSLLDCSVDELADAIAGPMSDYEYEYLDEGEAITESEWEEQARIILSLKTQGLLP